MKYGFIFHSLGILILTVFMMTGSFWAGVVYGIYLIRIIRLGNRSFLTRFIIIQVLLASYLLYFNQSHHSRINGEAEQITLDVAVTAIKVEGDLLSFVGETKETGDETSEKVQVFYYLEDESSQKAWLAIDQSIQLRLTGSFDQAGKNENFHLFNYKDYLAHQDIYWIFSPDTLQILGNLNQGKYWLANQQKQILSWLEKLAHPTVRAYSLSLFFNEMDALNPDALDAYTSIGLIHLFSISGFHVQYFLTFFKQIFLRLGLTVDQFDYLAIGILVIYTMLLGFPYGMIRSCVTYIYNVFQTHTQRPPNAIIGTTIAMVGLIFVNPRAVFTLSFQLTFALSYTILFMGKAIQQRYKHPLKIEFVQSLLCTLVTIPFLISSRFEFSWVSLILNYGYSWVFASFLFPGLLAVLLLQLIGLGPLFFWFQQALAYIIQGVEGVAIFAQKWTWFQWVTGKPVTWVMIIFVISLLIFMVSFSQIKRSKWANLLMVSSVILLYLNPYLHRYGQVAMLDVDQGDSLMIELPFQKAVYLVDVAGKFNFATDPGQTDASQAWKVRDTETLAERQIIPSLKAAGVRKIDGVFLTHGDFDHIGSFGELAKAFKIDHLYLPIGMAEDTTSLQSLAADIKVSRNPQMTIHWLKAGDQVQLGYASQLQVLAPEKVGAGENKDSLVLYGKLGHHKFLFTGDIEGREENNLPQVAVDILKIAHHGSDHSTPLETIKKFNPTIAWISVGEGNRYGHPSDRLVTDLEAQQIKIYRTDTMGAVHYIYWPKSAKIESVYANEEVGHGITKSDSGT